MLNRVILIGASAGGVNALSRIAAALPADLPAAVLMVLHVSPYGRSAMPAILSRAGKLPARNTSRWKRCPMIPLGRRAET